MPVSADSQINQERRPGWRRPGAAWVREVILGCALIAIVGYFVLPPFVALIFGSITDSQPGDTPHFTTETLKTAYTNHSVYNSLLNSLIYSLSTSTLVVVLGAFLAWVTERTDSAASKMTDLFSVTPILMPSVMLVSAWIMLLGPGSGMTVSYTHL